MQNKLYIPISSLNFNSIFSSENISPQIFYGKRCFGYKRNTQVAFQPLENAILLFNKLFHFKINNSDFEEYPIFIGVSEEFINSAIRSKVSNEQIEISIVDSTIYFDTNNFVFIFPNASIQQTIISKSLSSFETKTVSKYLRCFKTLDEYKDEIIELSLPEIKCDSDYKPEILKDESFDSLKGLFYCLILGHFFSKPKHLLEIELTITKIQNDFGGFKSDIELSGSKTDFSYSKDWKKSKYSTTDFSNEKYKSLLEQIEVLTARIIETFGKKSKEALIKEFISYLNLDFELLKPFYSIKGMEDFVFKKAQQQTPAPEYLAKGLLDIVKSYYYNSTNSYQKEKLDNEFKDQLGELSSILQNIFQPNIDEQKIELLKTFAIQLDRFDFYNFFATQKISEEDFKLYQIICEVLFKNRKRHKGETEIEIKNEILKQIGGTINQEFGKKSEESEYLRNFYNLLNNKKHNFNIQDTKHNTLQAIVALLINIDSAERLEEFIIEQNLKHRFISLSFFGLYVGFAGLGKTLTNKIFDTKNYALLNSIDSVLLKRNLETIPETKVVQTVNEPQTEYKKATEKKEPKVSKQEQKKIADEKAKEIKSNEQNIQPELGL
jgi:hypothetical protein